MVRRYRRALGKPLLYFACRHHMLEVIPKQLFDKMVEASSSPDLGTLCKNFEAAWDEMDKTKFSPATEDPDAAPILSSESVDKALKFCLETVEVHFKARFFLFTCFFFFLNIYIYIKFYFLETPYPGRLQVFP